MDKISRTVLRPDCYAAVLLCTFVLADAHHNVYTVKSPLIHMINGTTPTGDVCTWNQPSLLARQLVSMVKYCKTTTILSFLVFASCSKERAKAFVAKETCLCSDYADHHEVQISRQHVSFVGMKTGQSFHDNSSHGQPPRHGIAQEKVFDRNPRCSFAYVRRTLIWLSLTSAGLQEVRDCLPCTKFAG